MGDDKDSDSSKSNEPQVISANDEKARVAETSEEDPRDGSDSDE